MGKAIHKPRPSMPRWWWLYEQCALCKKKNNCNQCKLARHDSKHSEKLAKKHDRIGIKPKED